MLWYQIVQLLVMDMHAGGKARGERKEGCTLDCRSHLESYHPGGLSEPQLGTVWYRPVFSSPCSCFPTINLLLFKIMEKGREFQRNIYFCFIDYAKAFDCVDHNKLWKF